MASIRERTAKDGTVSFTAQVRMRGQLPQVKTFHTRTAAERWARNTEAAIDEGRHFKTAEAKRHTLREAIDRYLKDVLPQYKDIAKPSIHLRFWKDRLGHVLLSDLTLSLIVEERDRLLREGLHPGKPENRQLGPSTANRYTTSFSRLLSVCVRDWGWMEDSPMRKLRKMKEPGGRVRYLSDEERRNLLDACRKSSNRFLYTAVLLALNTGARRSEIWELKWSQVDLARKVLVLDQTKNSETRVVPLVGSALEALQEMNRTERRLDTEFVFPAENVPGKAIDFRTAWENAVQEAGLKDFRWHDLRHSAASYLAMSGATPPEIAAVLGHKTLQMVKRYAHLSEAHNTAVLERMHKRFLAEGA